MAAAVAPGVAVGGMKDSGMVAAVAPVKAEGAAVPGVNALGAAAVAGVKVRVKPARGAACQGQEGARGGRGWK